MKKYSSSIFIPIIIFLVLFALTLPLLLAHELNAETSLTFPNLLSYYGSILGAGATIGAVVLTINYNRKLNEEERIHNKKQIEDERIHNKNLVEEERTLLNKPYFLSSCKIIEYEENPDPNTININIDLDETFLLTRFVGGAEKNEIDDRFIYHTNDYKIKKNQCFVEYIVENVGGGHAINIATKLSLNQKSLYPTYPFAIPLNRNKAFHIFFYSQNQDYNLKGMNIELTYSNIFSKIFYRQYDHLIFYRDRITKQLLVAKSQTISPPSELVGYTRSDMPKLD
ncbi:hypothetical protein ACIZ62_13045 [Acetobacterium carbinolicum]|uniref:hypothetical protein n=1 Tax=Acetobacterium carbinolicum TaxID=52690 RepID=UPI0039BF8F33